MCAGARELLSELRSPLAAVRVGADLLLRSDLSEPQRKRVARNVSAATARIDEILAELASFFGSSDYEKGDFDLLPRR